ncbi:MAG: hypothetical protein R3E00_17285 [Paracoccaceae bacterium]
MTGHINASESLKLSRAPWLPATRQIASGRLQLQSHAATGGAVN